MAKASALRKAASSIGSWWCSGTAPRYWRRACREQLQGSRSRRSPGSTASATPGRKLLLRSSSPLMTMPRATLLLEVRISTMYLGAGMPNRRRCPTSSRCAPRHCGLRVAQVQVCAGTNRVFVRADGDFLFSPGFPEVLGHDGDDCRGCWTIPGTADQ